MNVPSMHQNHDHHQTVHVKWSTYVLHSCHISGRQNGMRNGIPSGPLIQCGADVVDVWQMPPTLFCPSRLGINIIHSLGYKTICEANTLYGRLLLLLSCRHPRKATTAEHVSGLIRKRDENFFFNLLTIFFFFFRLTLLVVCLPVYHPA